MLDRHFAALWSKKWGSKGRSFEFDQELLFILNWKYSIQKNIDPDCAKRKKILRIEYIVQSFYDNNYVFGFREII